MSQRRCTCTKACHPTLLAALTQRAKLWTRRGYRLRAYRCNNCRHYHLTSKPSRNLTGPWPDCPAGIA